MAEQHGLRLSITKEKIFRLILILLPFVFVVLFEVLLRVVGYGPNLNLFINLEHHSAYYKINPELGARYFPSLLIKPQTSADVLLKKKPANGFRVFVLGGSSAFGYPYGRNGALSSFLKDRLQAALPTKEVEVVNLAMCAVGSYAVLDIGLELLDYQPDALVIYAGHNEFYGALGVGSTEFISESRGWVKTYLKLRRFKIYQLLREIIVKIKNSIHRQPDSAPSVRLMEHMAGEQLIPYQSDLFNQAEQIYFENLNELVSHAVQKNVPLYLGELVSNLRDLPPFRSIFVSENERQQFEKIAAEVEALLAQKEIYRALKKLQATAAQYFGIAQFYYLKARCFESLNQPDSARSNYQRARDRDGLRFRAPEEFNVVLKQIAAAEKLVTFVPLQTIFEQHSRNGLVGNNLMTDHLHPNLSGYFLMGKTIFDAMLKNLPAADRLQIAPAKPDSIFWRESGVTELDTVEANFRSQLLLNSWPFKLSRLTIADLNWNRQNMVEQLAVDMIQDRITWEQAKVQLAEFYIRNKNFERALVEYESLIKLTPYNASPYLQAARIHMHQRCFAEALSLFLRSTKIEKTLLAYQGLGEAYLHLGQAAAGIPYLEAALSAEQDNPLTLFLLAQSYYRAGEKQKSQKIAAQLKRLNPHFPGLTKLLQNLGN